MCRWRAREKEVRVTAGDDEGEGLCIRRGGCGRCSLAFLKEDRVNVAFEMINGDEGKVVGESEGFGVGDADEQCTSEARARSDGNGIEIGEVNVGFSKRGADNGNDGAKVLAAGELGHDAAVERVGRDLRGNDGRKSSRSALDDRRGRFVAGGFDAENEAGAGHESSLVVLRKQGAARRARIDGTTMAGSEQFGAALKILETLRSKGYEAYFAGGCVRDLLLGREPADYDVATSATPDVVLEMFPRTFAVGAHFGVVLVAPEVEDAGFVTEVATFRSDLSYSDGRHPDAVRYTKTAEEDVRRRDFTINGLLLDPMRVEEVNRRCFDSVPTSPLGSHPQDDSCKWERGLICAARSSITSAGWTIWMRALCARSGVQNSGLKKTICACCAG